VGDEVKLVAGRSGVEDGLEYEDGEVVLADGRTLAWRWCGPEGARPVLRLQGTPGSRLYRHPDAQLEKSLGVRYLLADRPGFGGSTRLPGRGVAQFADDLAALLDAHGLDRVPVMGTSGGGPHTLAFAAKHPERTAAATVIVGAAPVAEDEVAQMVGTNAQGYAAAEKGWDALFELLTAIRERLLGPEGMAGVLNDAPAKDREIMSSPVWQRLNRATTNEALKQGAEGWTDESMAFHGEWDFDPGTIQSSVTWWHGDDDKNAPLSAARRAIARIPGAQLRLWHDEGHFASLVHEPEIVEELLARA
jgi:pimeloyl-ACP methyl ester carboxylesterase